MRVVLEDGTNLGVMTASEALARARQAGLDLIEIAPSAKPPVVKIVDFGKYQYQERKKERLARAKAQPVETKSLQVRIGTGEHDLELKAQKASEFLAAGHRVRIELFLRGRARFLDKAFLKERLERILHLITVEHKVADGPKPSAKGISIIIERVKK